MFAVIMTGGSGTRFWPVSRRHKPKQFLSISGPKPMVVETCDRLSPIVRDKDMILVLGQEHLTEATGLFSDRPVHMVAEPVGRNTAPCMGLGAIYAKYLGCEGAVAFLPADHYIADPASFVAALRAAGAKAESGGIVTLGIVPNRPETGYGYIRRGLSHNDPACEGVKGQKTYRVSEFVEKPNLEKALTYLSSGDYYWNAGIFVATADTILQEIQKLLPDLYQGLMRLEKVLGTDLFDAELARVYGSLEGISFDYGIMEKTREEAFVVPCECGWSDVGSWSALYELKASDYDEAKNLSEGETLLIECEGGYVSAQSGRLVVCLGLRDFLVVDTPETLLVTNLDRSQDIRKIVDRLKRTGKEGLL
jgi:mannose-1-phosphate guanylyltransferase